jgi:vacuolar protein-sorting-associated protein 4
MKQPTTTNRVNWSTPNGISGGIPAGNRDFKAEADAEKAELRGALSKVIVTEKPNVKWKDVAGLAQAKEILEYTVIFPKMHPHLFTGIRQPATGILLYGPPGTGEAPW